VFQRQGSGHVIAVSSIVGVRGVPGGSVYSATKAAQKHSLVAAIRVVRNKSPRVGRVSDFDAYPSFATPWRVTSDHAVSGVGPRQDPDIVAAAIERCIDSPRAEVYPLPSRVVAGPGQYAGTVGRRSPDATV
jgi:NADP-dependent 3-hydroxy acid dehydrogenase YdfG